MPVSPVDPPGLEAALDELRRQVKDAPFGLPPVPGKAVTACRADNVHERVRCCIAHSDPATAYIGCCLHLWLG